MTVNGERQTEIANTLMLLYDSNYNSGARKRVFTCKTCNKEFSSFQALGGHRASHKKPAAALNGDTVSTAPSKPKNTTHECSVCGKAFGLGQALGGHMRRHRNHLRTETAAKALGLLPAPVMMEKSSGNGKSKRVLCWDLNLTPLENYLKLELGSNLTPLVKNDDLTELGRTDY